MATTVSPAQLHDLLTGRAEHALIDARDIDPFSQRHLLFAVPLPLGRLELLAADLLPRRSVRVIVCDDGEGLAERAALRLEALGYSDVAVLAGGIQAWEAAGFEVFSGVNVPSKAFGEFVEHAEGTPALNAAEVNAMVEAGEDVVILDSRPPAEFTWASIPGGICCSGAELAYRAFSTVPSPDTTVVVNCAGRTRSIIGAQSLINAQLPNKVFALENGIMGWRLAGLQPAHGETRHAQDPSPEGLARARAAARQVAQRFGVEAISPQQLDQWRSERDAQTLYVLDVRTLEEFEAGHLADAVHAPGGQLVQATDQYVGVRNARLVLIDDDQVRAIMTASWLIQMGLPNVRVLDADLHTLELWQGPRRAPVLGLEALGGPEAGVRQISPTQAQQLIGHGVVIVDLALSAAYRRSHIPGAWYAARARLEASLAALPQAGQLVLTSEDGVLARLAATEAAALTDRVISVLDGGNAGWRDAGLPLTDDDAQYAVSPDDAWRIPLVADEERGLSAEDAMRAYLDWETDLVRQVAKDGTTRFRHFPRSDA